MHALGLAALRKYYPFIIENLPSNHLISLLRLQNVVSVPMEIVDSIVPSPSAEISNKMIVNYLIGLIHNEEQIITFCKLVKHMITEFEKCISVLNLQNCKKYFSCNYIPNINLCAYMYVSVY